MPDEQITTPCQWQRERAGAVVTRRRFLGLCAASLPVAGCAGAIHGRNETALAFRSPNAPQIRLLIFEHVRQSFPFHTSAIINAPQGRVLYDPGGWWAGAPGQRIGDVTHGMTPEREETYVQRDYFGAAPGTWRVHHFDAALSSEQASLAFDLSQAMPPVVFGLCCWALTSVIRQLDRFADVGLWFWPSTLLAHLQHQASLQPDLLLSMRVVPDSSSA